MSQTQLWTVYELDCGGPGGSPRPTLSNAVKVLEHDKAFTGVIWFDEFLGTIMTTIGGDGARTWTDADDLNLTVDLQDRVGIATIQSFIARDAVIQYARRRPRHEVREYLLALRWDSEPRIALAFEEHWGVDCDEFQPCDYVRAISHNLFVGMVARILAAGCQLDTMVVFEGKQGTKKTSALRVLGGEWYALNYEPIGSKDFLQALNGKWLVEIGELDAFSKVEVTRVKSTLSNTNDNYRASFGRRAEGHKRQCVFAGTTNADTWGTDETGLRRFWPLRCGEINTATLTAARDQLFAEAVVLFQQGATWWEVPASAEQIQADRQVEHAWADLILPTLALRAEITVAEVLVDILKHDPHQITQAAEKTVGKVLRHAGWTKKTARRGLGQKPKKVWFAPDTGNG